MRFIARQSAAIGQGALLAAVALLVGALLFGALSRGAAPAAAQPASLVGTYDGRQMEMAAALELRADGRFRYALSYGALDEEAAGSWALAGGRVVLTSDPVIAPRFVLVSRGRGADGVLQLSLDVPKGLSRQYFDALIATRNGETRRAQLSEDGLTWPIAGDNAPTGIRLVFPVFRVVSESVPLDPASGYAVRLRFEPNDLGKVDFRATPLTIANRELLLDRHGRTIRFRRSGR